MTDGVTSKLVSQDIIYKPLELHPLKELNHIPIVS
jgi:hypothetical protein